MEQHNNNNKICGILSQFFQASMRWPECRTWTEFEIVKLQQNCIKYIVGMRAKILPFLQLLGVHLGPNPPTPEHPSMDPCQIPYAQTGLQSCNQTSMSTICKAVASKFCFVMKQGKKVSRQLTIKQMFPVLPIYIRKYNHILINKNHDCFPTLLQDPAHKTRGKNKATKYTYQNQEVNTEFLQLPAQA